VTCLIHTPFFIYKSVVICWLASFIIYFIAMQTYKELITSVLFPVSLPAIKFDPWISTLAYRLHVENPKLGIEQILLLNISPEIKTLGWRFLRIWFDPITRNLQRMYLNCNILENFRVLDSWNNYIKLKTSGRRNHRDINNTREGIVILIQ
jgi:hypothetical protein